MTVRELQLRNFRAFRDFRLVFGSGAYLIGPNNAGKTTILTALRISETLIRWSRSRSADTRGHHEGRQFPAYSVHLKEYPGLASSIRHNFGTDETSLRLTFNSGAILTVVWPDESDTERDADPFFYLERSPGLYVSSPKQARTHFPPLGIIPTLGTLEDSETLLEQAYMRKHIGSRLSSRHFRNQLYDLSKQGGWEEFVEWVATWTSEIQLDRIYTSFQDGGMKIFIEYVDADSSSRKELSWVGDGIQIWLQLLFHVHRLRDTQTLILDEPEVFLHPDLQRRLVALLENSGKQVILATHSSEIASAVDRKLIGLVDKSASRLRRPKSEGDLQALSELLGTAFNVRLARALKAKSVLFVEGKDMQILRRFAETLALSKLARETEITILQLNSYSAWGNVKPFEWILEKMLPQALTCSIILDRDYRTDSQVDKARAELEEVMDYVHIWERKEIESYLLTPPVIARSSGAPLDEVETLLSAAIAEQRADIFARLLSEKAASEKSATNHAVSITTEFVSAFDIDWMDESFRLARSNPKTVIRTLNAALQENSHKSVSSVGLARQHRRHEIPPEMAETPRAIEGTISS